MGDLLQFPAGATLDCLVSLSRFFTSSFVEGAEARVMVLFVTTLLGLAVFAVFPGVRFGVFASMLLDCLPKLTYGLKVP